MKRYALLLSLISAFAVALPLFTLQLPSAFGTAKTGCGAWQSSWLGLHPVLPAASDAPRLRAVSYNLHSGLGPDWRPFAGRDEVEARLRAIAARIAASAPADAPVDAVGLNEVDFGSRRSGWLDQARFLAGELERLTGYRYHVVAGETWRRDWPGLEVRFGNALLTRHPLLTQRTCSFGTACADEQRPPLAPSGGGLLARFLGEPRGIVQARIDFHGLPVELMVIHLEAFVPAQRETQAAELLERFVSPGVSTLVLGDINAVPTTMTDSRRHFAADRTHDILTGGRLIDARVALAARVGATDLAQWATYPAQQPMWPLDAALASADFGVVQAQVIGETESDHRGLAVEYRPLSMEDATAQARWHARVRGVQAKRILACDFGSTPAAGDPGRDWLQRVSGGDTTDVPPMTL